MNQSKKTSSFLRAINKYAQEQSEAIRLETEEFRKQEVEKATSEALESAYVLIQKEIAANKAVIVSDVAKREQEYRRELFIKRNEIVEKVFAMAQQKLVEFAKSEDYAGYLIKSAEKIAALFGSRECIVYMRKDDLDKADAITKIIPNSTVECDDDITLGGIKAYCKELSVLADESIDTKLNEQRLWFTENSGLKVV